jgi:hypothetical protein
MVIGNPYHWATALALLLCELVCLCIMFWGADSVQSAWKRESNTSCVRSHCSEMSRTHQSVVVALKVIGPTRSHYSEMSRTHLSILVESNAPRVRSHYSEMSRTHLLVLVVLKVIRPTSVLVALKLIFFKTKY